MTWFSKVKGWYQAVKDKVLGKKEVVEVKEVPSAVAVVEVEVPKPAESELSKKAKEVRALGPRDLVRTAPVKQECAHILTFKKQTWVRVSDKKFELQNEMMCTKCTSHKTQPIR